MIVALRVTEMWDSLEDMLAKKNGIPEDQLFVMKAAYFCGVKQTVNLIAERFLETGQFNEEVMAPVLEQILDEFNAARSATELCYKLGLPL